MLVVKDSMVLIHLAKLSLLERACQMLKGVIIPMQVKNEFEGGIGDDVVVIKNLMSCNKIKVVNVSDVSLIKKANQFNIQGGEAEALALYWQENADLFATDDDNVRKKRMILNLNLIGTPAIMLKLHAKGMVEKSKMLDSISELSKIGWFSTAVIDIMMNEVKK
jgi:predicted nucleic acid-binding protein